MKLQNCHDDLGPKFLDTINKAIVSELKGYQNGILVERKSFYLCFEKKFYQFPLAREIPKILSKRA